MKLSCLCCWVVHCGVTQSSFSAISTGVRRSMDSIRKLMSGLDSTTQPSLAWGTRANWSEGTPCSQMPLPVRPCRRSQSLG